MANLTRERLMELLSYDSASGDFTWNMRAGTRGTPGKLAGRLWNKQYRRISIDGQEHQAHRLAWLYVYGEWPIGEVDHINRIKDDNRIQNLRCIGRAGNQQNKGIPSNNKSGVKGVYWHHRDRVWMAGISVDGRKKYIGSFKDLTEASTAYREAKRRLHIA